MRDDVTEYIDEVIRSQQYKYFLMEVVKQHTIASFNRLKRKRVSVNIPVLVLYGGSYDYRRTKSLTLKSAVIRNLIEYPYPETANRLRAQGIHFKTKLGAEVTIDGFGQIYEVPLLEDGELVEKAGVFNNKFCIVSVDYDMREESVDEYSEFYCIKQMVDKLEGTKNELEEIEHVIGLMSQYVQRLRM